MMNTDTLDAIVSSTMNDEQVTDSTNNTQTQTQLEQYGFDMDSVKTIKDEYDRDHNAELALHKIAERLFRQQHIRSLACLNIKGDKADYDKAMAIKTAYLNVQGCVIQKLNTRKVKIAHKKGDIKRDSAGNPIPRANGNGCEEWTKDTTETAEITELAPVWDIASNPDCQWRLIDKLEDEVVMPDFTELTNKLCVNTDYAKACDIIRKLTDYYIFEDSDKFVERFALFIANAKSRVLNMPPEWPVMFSLVGNMGDGKGWLSDMLIDTHDEVFETKSSQSKYSQLFHRFNSVMLTRGLIHLDEKNGVDATNRETLKNYITERNISIELKGKEPYTQPNMATLLSTTNESIKDMAGLQKDRRIVEFRLLGRKRDENGDVVKIDEAQMKEWLKELWTVMPCAHPNPKKIIDELLEESAVTLDAQMEELTYTLFEEHQSEFLTGNFVAKNKLRQAIKAMGSVRANDILSWLEGQQILTQQKSGAYYLRKSNLDKLMDKMRDKMAYTPEGEEKIENTDEINKMLFG